MGRRGAGDLPGGLRRGAPKRGLKEALDAEVATEVEALVGPGAAGGLELEAIETAVRRRVLAVAARAIAGRLNADQTDYVGPSLSCVACHKPARYAGRRHKCFKTALGEMTLERAYYHCETCHVGFCPRDRALFPILT